MAWFTSTEDYSLNDNFYGEPVISYCPSEGDSTTGTPPASSGPWDDYQHERENLGGLIDVKYTR